MAVCRVQQVAELCCSAFEAEHQARYFDALQIHNNAVVALGQLADDASFFDRERKRIARKQIKFHAGRIQILQPIINGQLPGLQVVLPTSLSAKESLSVIKDNQPALSMEDEFIRCDALMAAGPITDMHTVTAALCRGLPYLPWYTLSLDPSLPPTTYHIYVSSEAIIMSGRWFYYKVKDSSERQTLYVLQAFKRRHYQIPSTTLSRAAEFTTPCVITRVMPVPARPTGFENHIGREMMHCTASPLPVSDKPDRTKHIQWSPRRFNWGGRRFVWQQNKGTTGVEDLREVKQEWPQPGSKTGKMLDESFEERLVWGEAKFGLKKCAVIHFKGGMDQIFRELCLASQLTRIAILMHGHDR